MLATDSSSVEAVAGYFDDAEGGIRTHKGQPPTVFETVAYTVPPLRRDSIDEYTRNRGVRQICSLLHGTVRVDAS